MEYLYTDEKKLDLRSSLDLGGPTLFVAMFRILTLSAAPMVVNPGSRRTKNNVSRRRTFPPV
jgi:hypothetical protein